MPPLTPDRRTRTARDAGHAAARQAAGFWGTRVAETLAEARTYDAMGSHGLATWAYDRAHHLAVYAGTAARLTGIWDNDPAHAGPLTPAATGDERTDR